MYTGSYGGGGGGLGHLDSTISHISDFFANA